MPWQFQCRLLSLVLTVALVASIEQYSYWLAAVIGLGFTHYALSFYYAGARMRQLGNSRDFALPLLSLSGLCAVVYFLEFPLEVYFGLHHAFNEAYLKRYGDKSAQHADEKLAPYRCMFHLAAYFCILRTDPQLKQFPAWLMWSFSGLIALLYMRKVFTLGGKDIKATLADQSVELGLILVVALSFFFKITFLQVVMYHFVLWTLLPLPMMKQRGGWHLEQYLLLTIATLALLFGGLLVIGPGKLSSVLSIALTQFYIWSYIHITASFALSSAHPKWIVQLFAPSRQTAVNP